jgi:hypothetical protein
MQQGALPTSLHTIALPITGVKHPQGSALLQQQKIQGNDLGILQVSGLCHFVYQLTYI